MDKQLSHHAKGKEYLSLFIDQSGLNWRFSRSGMSLGLYSKARAEFLACAKLALGLWLDEPNFQKGSSWILVFLLVKRSGSKPAHVIFWQARARPGSTLKTWARLGLEKIELVPPLGPCSRSWWLENRFDRFRRSTLLLLFDGKVIFFLQSFL